MQTEYPGQPPQVVEDQVTYPLSTSLLAVPRCEKRSRLLLLRPVVRLRHLRGRHRHLLGAQPGAGIPVAERRAFAGRCDTAARTRRHRRGVGLSVRPGRHHESNGPVPAAVAAGLVSQVRTLGHTGVSEVASVGGFVRQYQIDVDTAQTRTLWHPSASCGDGRPQCHQCDRARLLELGETEFMVRSQAYVGDLEDLRQLPIHVSEGRPPVLLSVRSGCAPRAGDPSRGGRAGR